MDLAGLKTGPSNLFSSMTSYSHNIHQKESSPRFPFIWKEKKIGAMLDYHSLGEKLLGGEILSQIPLQPKLNSWITIK